MATRWFVAVAMAAATAAAIAGGCSGNKNDDGRGAGYSNGSGNGDGFDDGNTNCELAIDPPEAEIVVDEGMSSPIELRAMRCGTQVYPESWEVDYGTIATVSNKGQVSATNQRGGQVTVTATESGATATAKVAVQLRKTVNDEMISPEDQAALLGATEKDGAVTWAYPYDGTVWPRGLLPPEMMWIGGVEGDAYLLRFSSKYVDLKVFTYALAGGENGPSYTLSPENWVAINEVLGTDGKTALWGARLSGGAASVIVEQGWTMARANMRGTVYYWSNSLKRMVRIKPGEAAPDDFMAAADLDYDCSGCHVVSADGLTFIIGGDIDEANVDLLSMQTVLTGGASRDWGYAALSPEGKWMVQTNSTIFPGFPGGSDGLWDAKTGTRVAGSGLDGAYLEHPTFSPKGHKLVYVGGAGDLRAYDFDGQVPAVSNDTSLLAAGSGGEIQFPSVSPTVQAGGEQGAEKTYVVYHRGNIHTGKGPGDLYLASLEENAVEWRLDAANGEGYPFAAGARDLAYNYEPTFAPAASGGYFWVVFTSRRTYGNRLTGESSKVKQLWMVAIEAFPEPGTDPSHAAFYVPGQDSLTLNMRGFWALDPCVQLGNACEENADCCDGKACQEGVCGGPESCVELGGLCKTTADCCDPAAECIANECALAGPK